MTRLREIVRILRSPDGCPWDREQTNDSLRAGLLEEAYETIDAITLGDEANLCEELGDLLLQVVMHAQIAAERGTFTFDEAAAGVCEKLIRRHPHVFGEGEAASPDAVLRQWEQIKRAEKGADASVLQGLPRSLPALMRAQNAQKKAARVGFDWSEPEGVLDKLREEIGELAAEIPGGDTTRLEEEVGDLLFTVVNLARRLGLEAEVALETATEKFIRRFQAVEARLRAQDRRPEDTPPAELDRLWEEVKAGEKSRP